MGQKDKPTHSHQPNDAKRIDIFAVDAGAVGTTSGDAGFENETLLIEITCA